MLRKLVESLVVWLVVAIVLWLLAELLGIFNLEVTEAIARFLSRTNVIIGFLCGLWHFFFGGLWLNR
jgi:hypothetical protein